MTSRCVESTQKTSVCDSIRWRNGLLMDALNDPCRDPGRSSELRREFRREVSYDLRGTSGVWTFSFQHDTIS